MSSDRIIREPAQALEAIVSGLDSLDIPYFMVGSFASGVRGEFRATNDIDLVSKISVAAVAELIKVFANDFYCDEVTIPKALKAKQSFNIIHQESFIKVDFFTKIGDFEEDQFARATDVKIPESTKKVKTATAEYNILAKLRWYLKSNRQLEMQLRDVIGMITINRRSLDYQYLSDWAKILNLTAVLEEVLQKTY